MFLNGRSQAVRLPAEFRFSESEVYVRRDGATGDVILSSHSPSWDGFLRLLDDHDPQGKEQVADFLSARIDAPPQSREIF